MAANNERAVVDLVINGEQSKATLKEISKAAIEARRDLFKMRESDDPAAFQKKLTEFQKLAAAESGMSARLKGSMSMLDKFKANAVSTMAGMVGGNLITAGFQQLIGLVPVITEGGLRIKDSFADIAKNADMTERQVEALNEKLYDMPTRTTTEELREMAATGGQFGVAAKDMEAYVDGANQVQVALGDQFGSAEETAGSILKLRNIFTGLRTDKIDQDLLHIGNALNVLEADGAATAPVMTDLASRIGGVLIPLGLSEDKVLGMSATLQELNVTAERGGTAVVNIFQKMLTETSAFAKTAGIPLKEYKELISKDIYGAFMKYIEGLKKVGGNQNDFMATLEKAKLTGAGEMEVLSKLTSNTEMLGLKVEKTGKAIQSTDSITAEYDKKNLSLAVNLKKLGDLKEQLLLKMLPFAEGIVSLTTRILGLTSASENATKTWEAQRDTVKGLERDMNPLLKRHDELKGKTNLTKKEQGELKEVIQKIAETIPSAVTQFDRMGNAMAISTTKAREYVRQQQEVLKYTNRVAIGETDSELSRARSELQRLLTTKASGVTYRAGSMGQTITDRLTNSDLIDLQKQIEKLVGKDGKGGLIAELEARRAGLSGNFLNAQTEGAKPAPPLPGVPTNNASGSESSVETKGEKAERLAGERRLKMAQKQEDSYAQLVMQARERTAKFEENAFEKEQLQFGEHYAKLLAMAGSNKERQAEVAALMIDELAAIEAREADRQQKAREKENQAREKEQAEELKDQREYNELMLEMADRQLTVLYEQERQAIDAQQAQGLINQKTYHQRQLDAEKVYLEARKQLYLVYGEDLAETNAALGTNQNEQTKATLKKGNDDWRELMTDQQRAELADANDRVTTQWKIMQELVDNEDLSAKQRKAVLADLRESQAEYVMEAIGGIKQWLGEHTVAYKAAVAAERAYAIAKIALNTQKEVSDIWANPIWSAMGPLGIAIKVAMTAAAIGRSAGLAAKVSGIAMKDDGGFTSMDQLYGGAKGFKRKPTMVNKGGASYIVGERRPEWIMGGEMLQNPLMANLAYALEALQQTGGYRQLSTLPTAGSPAPGGGADLMPLLLEMQAMRGELRQQAAKKVQFNYDVFEQFRHDIDEAKSTNTY